MSELKYRLLSGNDPQGKQKIWFCCHPDDFELYFDLISEDIFRRNENCAIWYDADPKSEYDREQLLFELGEMQLFVVPVTKRLLTKPSRALEVELPFAMGKLPAPDGERKHIAVLPVMFEKGLYKLFNTTETFEGMQYLNRYTDDESALTFDEKLKLYLWSVLVSEQDTQRIRDEFRACIFLSYRKMDRRFARSLMEMIHSCDFCRDVSIWYDEFLVPGESWRKEIEEKLKKSDLFVLNVTTGVFEDDNFVYKKEYPMALDSRKPILSVMTEPVDLKIFEDIYREAMEQLVDAAVPDKVKDGLAWGLVHKAGRKDLLKADERAEHLYYIALGYKNGVGVENNSERAVCLLEISGEKGWRKAYMTLGEMYANGDGVERDTDRAIGYYDRFIELQTPDFGTSKDGDYDLINAYDAKGMIYLFGEKLQNAFDTFAEMNRLLEDMTSCYGSFKQLNLPISYERLGNIKKAMGDTEAARAYFSKALDTRMNPPVTKNIATEEDAAKDDDAATYNERQALQGLAANLYNLGELQLGTGDLRKAKKNLSRACELFTRLVKEKEERDLTVNLGKTHCSLARLYRAAGYSQEALKSCGEAQAVLEPFARNPADTEARALIVAAAVITAKIFRENGRAQRADQTISNVLEEARKIAADNPEPRILDLYAETLGEKAAVLEMLGRKKDAMEYYRQEIEIAETLACSTEGPEYKRNYAIACEKAGEMLTKDPESTALTDYNAGIRYLLKDLEITQMLYNSNNPETRRDLYCCYDALHRGYYYTDVEKAMEYGVRALQVAWRLADESRQPEEYYNLGKLYCGIGRICADIKEKCFEHAMRLYKAAWSKSRNQEVGEKIESLQRMMQVRDPEFPLGPGYCAGLNELAERWPETEAGVQDIESIDPLFKSRNGFGREQKEQGNGKAERNFGCLSACALLVLIVIGLLQLTGITDVIGFLNGLMPHGGDIALVILAAIVLMPAALRSNSRKKL